MINQSKQRSTISKFLWRIVTPFFIGASFFLTPPIYAQSELEHVIYLPTIFKIYPEPTRGTVLAYSNCDDLGVLGISWYQNNGPYPPPGCPQSDTRFVPRIYDAALTTDSQLMSVAINNAKVSGWLIGFTEPNLPWHANITPQEGAQAWRTIEQAARPHGIKLVSPSPSQHDPGFFDPLGYTWIWHMVDAYQAIYGENPHFDAIAWNYYSPDVSQLQSYLIVRRQEADSRDYDDVPFWILEYAGECWNNGLGNFEVMSQVTPWLEQTPWITRYAWFTHRIDPADPWAVGWQSCSLVDPNTGLPTSLGVLYAGY